MSKQIEIYVRSSGDRILLNFYIPDELREAFIAGLKTGSFEPPDTQMNLEFSVLPEWLSEESRRASQPHEFGDLHVRLAVSSINTHFGD
jgi:hypothetical protein